MRMTLRVEDKKVRLGLKYLGDAIPRLTARQQEQAMKAAKKEASAYVGGNRYSVPIPRGSRYRRTGTYGRSFSLTKDGLSWRLESDAVQKGRAYTRYVGGMADGSGQIKRHKQTGWPNISEIVTKRVMTLVVNLEKDIATAAGAAGLPNKSTGLWGGLKNLWNRMF